MHAIDLFDEVRVTRLPPDTHSRHEAAWAPGAPHPSPMDWPMERDLAVRAHRLLESRIGRPLPAALMLTKRIPVGGGLGGGSSDAAAALLALNDLFRLGVERDMLADWSRAIGSDVAYFIDEAPPRPAFVAGFGDRIERTPRNSTPILLIMPPFGCTTPAVYKAFDALPSDQPDEAGVRAMARSGRVDLRALRNDLRRAAEAVEPQLAALAARAERAAGLPVHMSGSGSTMFVLGNSGAAARLSEALPGCAIVPTRLV
jgi:4-diphosphocytidyl-2-C-methyl-D-erythritol kinase